LESIEDVTDRVNQSVDSQLKGEAAVKARNAVFARIESESQKATGLQSNIVTLYGGAKYDLYRYKRFTDVRCAFAPEMAVAFFGGDPDNFEYPRYDLGYHRSSRLRKRQAGPRAALSSTFHPGRAGERSDFRQWQPRHNRPSAARVGAEVDARLESAFGAGWA